MDEVTTQKYRNFLDKRKTNAFRRLIPMDGLNTLGEHIRVRVGQLQKELQLEYRITVTLLILKSTRTNDQHILVIGR